MVNLETFKEYIRFEDAESDTFLKTFLDGAEETAAKAGVEKPETSAETESESNKNKLYEILIYMIAAHWYDNRGAASYGQYTQIPIGVNWIIQQLR